MWEKRLDFCWTDYILSQSAKSFFLSPNEQAKYQTADGKSSEKNGSAKKATPSTRKSSWHNPLPVAAIENTHSCASLFHGNGKQRQVDPPTKQRKQRLHRPTRTMTSIKILLRNLQALGRETQWLTINAITKTLEPFMKIVSHQAFRQHTWKRTKA